MIWVRKLLVSFFSAIALLALISSVLSYSLNRAFATPDHLESWLDQSQLYEHFVATTVAQATQVSADQGNSAPVTLSGSDSTVQQATQTAFPKQLINQSIMNFFNANYSWLEGTTTAPQFEIDLTDAKAQFGQQIGKAVADHLRSVPECTAAQLSTMQSTDLLHIGCRPAGVNPDLEALQVEQQLNDTGGVLGNPVLTADSLTPQKDSNTPYYKQFSYLPTAYKLAQKLPYILGALALISLLIIFFAASSRRGSWRLIAKLFVVAGLLLVVGKFTLDFLIQKAQDKLFNNTTNGALQQSLTDFAHRASNYITHINFIAGLGYLGIGALIIMALLITRFGRKKPIPPVAAKTTTEVSTADVPTTSKPAPTKPSRRIMDGAEPSKITVDKPIATASAVTEGKPKGLGRRGIIQ